MKSLSYNIDEHIPPYCKVRVFSAVGEKYSTFTVFPTMKYTFRDVLERVGYDIEQQYTAFIFIQTRYESWFYEIGKTRNYVNLVARGNGYLGGKKDDSKDK